MKENTNLWFIYDNGKTGKTLFPVQQIFHSLSIFFPDFPAMACIYSNMYMVCTMGLRRRIEKSLWLNYWDWKMILIFFFAPLQFPFTSAKKLIYFPRQLLLFQFSPFIPRQITIFVYMLLADMWDPIKYIHSLSLKSEIR